MVNRQTSSYESKEILEGKVVDSIVGVLNLAKDNWFYDFQTTANIRSILMKNLWVDTTNLFSDGRSTDEAFKKNAEELNEELRKKANQILLMYQNTDISSDAEKESLEKLISSVFKNLQSMSYVKWDVEESEKVDEESEDSEDVDWSPEKEQETPKTPQEKIRDLEKEIKDMQVLYPDIIRVSLLKTPTQIPKYMARKIRNRKINRKSRNPIDFVYTMRMWQRKWFVPASRKIKNAYPLCKKLIKEQERIMRENSGADGFRPEYLNAKNRLDQLKIVLPQLEQLATTNTWQLKVGASDYGKKTVA